MSFGVAGLALGDMDLEFCVASVALMALGWLSWWAWFPFVAVDAAAVCVASVALGDIDFHSVWQAWRLATSVAGVALMALGWL